MEGTILEQRGRRSRATVALLAYAGAAAFVVATVWYGLATQFVTVAGKPVRAPNESIAALSRRFFAWVISTLPQERLSTRRSRSLRSSV
jgi:hypothetical protein